VEWRMYSLGNDHDEQSWDKVAVEHGHWCDSQRDLHIDPN
jgi:hypothetical protein